VLDRVQRLCGGDIQNNGEFVAPEPENAVSGTQAMAEYPGSPFTGGWSGIITAGKIEDNRRYGA
jgi:hypothetical protein